MINGREVTFEHIMDRVFDLGLNTQYVDDVVVREAMFTALTLFGAPESYHPKVELVPISSHRGLLPCDILDITHGGVRHYPSGVPLTAQTSVYQPDNAAPPQVQEVDPWFLDPQAPTLNTSGGAQLIDSMTYYIRGGYIYTGFSEGTVEMGYQAFPTDDRGYPVIPNNTRVIEGVVYYVAKVLASKLYMQDKLSRDKFEYINSECAWYMASASTALRIPTLDRMENIKNMMNTPVSQYNAHRNAFRGIGRQPHIRTHTR